MDRIFQLAGYFSFEFAYNPMTVFSENVSGDNKYHKQTTLMDGTVKIIQITDTHLFADDELNMFGVKSNVKFKEVIEKFIHEDSHDADMIFLTGDLS
ncbi:MAG: hypothetical protein H0W64_00710 [Gammaproteobacteria bacterium]|nr:hypothetical protein [Gammaproteobacteria bacterium]